MKDTVISRLRLQLEHKIKQVLQLKQEIKDLRGKEFHKKVQDKSRDELLMLKHEYNVLVVQNAK